MAVYLHRIHSYRDCGGGGGGLLKRSVFCNSACCNRTTNYWKLRTFVLQLTFQTKTCTIQTQHMFRNTQMLKLRIVSANIVTKIVVVIYEMLPSSTAPTPAFRNFVKSEYLLRHFCRSVSLSVCLSVRLSLCQYVSLSVCLSLCLSVYLSVYQCM
jgi:hypothetical protein